MGKNAENNTSPTDEDLSASSPTENIPTSEQNVIDLLKNDVSNSKSGKHFRGTKHFSLFAFVMNKSRNAIAEEENDNLYSYFARLYIIFIWPWVIKLKCNILYRFSSFRFVQQLR